MLIHKKNIICFITIFLFFLSGLAAQNFDSAKPYFDLEHESKVFGHKKFYRLYLPAGYTTSSKRYPVIYFFHGWGGRHFKDDNAKLEYEKLKQLVDKYQVILVMWDGNIDLSEPQPYNVGNYNEVKFQTQMKDYFPELISYIDSAYRTLSDRQHRAIIGFSMGGFMSLFLAGKYPDKVIAAVSFAGSPEFYVGYPGNNVLYPVRYTFKNLWDVDVKINNGTTDILYFLNEEVHAGAIWEEKKINYWRFIGPHMIDYPGQTKVFDTAVKFVVRAINTPASPPKHWSHYDLYPDFNLWGYQVESNKKEPGYIFLRNVGDKGFGLYTHKWLPDGPSLDSLQIKITTAPVYAPGKMYTVTKFFAQKNVIGSEQTQSDNEGRIHVELDGSGNQVGISKPDDDPDFVYLDCSLQKGAHFLSVNANNKLTIRLFNRGGENNMAPYVTISLRTADGGTKITDTVMRIKAIPGKRIIISPPFDISCSKKATPHAEPAEVKFDITVHNNKKICKDDFIVPVWFDVPYFNNIKIDDGISIRDSALGKGNADGVVNAGEKILVYQDTSRLRLYTDDPWVRKHNEKLISEVIPARWPDGFTLSSLIDIDPGCPDGHVIECIGHYETKTFNPIERKLHWGKVKLIVHHAN